MKKINFSCYSNNGECYHSLQDFVAINPPIGLASVAATAEKAGYEVSIIDGDAEQLTPIRPYKGSLICQPDYVGSTVMTATMDITQIFYEKLKS